MPESGREGIGTFAVTCNFTLMVIANGGRQIHTSHRGSFLRNFNVLLLYRPVSRLIYILTAVEGK